MSEHKEIYDNLVKRSRELQKKLNRINQSQRKSHSRGDDQAIERENEEVVDSLGENIRRELKQIDNAITRIEDGTYDTCSECGENIDYRRLEALPYTQYCIECASSK